MASDALKIGINPPCPDVPGPHDLSYLLTRRPALTALLFALVLWLVNPVGYIGGGADEYQYLIAARCTAEHGFCVPVDHWWRRWPIVAPSALALRVFGESYWSIALMPLAYAAASVALLAAIVARQFGRTAGTLVGVVFAATPIVSKVALEMGIDVPEFLFVLAAIAFLQRAYEDGKVRAIVLAGLMAGLATQARPTGMTLLPIVVGLFVLSRRSHWIVPFLIAAALPSVVEAITYAATAGDPLLGWKLSLAHTRIPSSELLPTVNPAHSPLFNPEYIGGWRRPMDIEVHWLVDGLLNYVMHPDVAFTLAAGLSLLALEWRSVVARDRAGRALVFAIALGVLWFGALTYGFAIDPKPRMFLPTLAVAATLFGALAPRRWATSRVLVSGAFILIVANGVIATYKRFDLRAYAAEAPEFIAAAGPDLVADPLTARFLALVPEARALPLFANRADQRKLLLLGPTSCAIAARDINYRGWRPVRKFAERPDDRTQIAWLRSLNVFFSPPVTPVMCVMVR